MSLDVSLRLDKPIVKMGTGIYVRENGSTRELKADEVSKYCPGHEDIVVKTETNIVFYKNITHNLGTMAKKAGLYKVMWCPEELRRFYAKYVIAYLATGLERLLRNPDMYKAFNPANGWGSYENMVDFVKEYLKACIEYPDAKIEVSR